MFDVKLLIFERNFKNSAATNTDFSTSHNQNLVNKKTSGTPMAIMYKPKEYDTNLVDDETEMQEAMRDIEKNASSKHVLNLFKLMDKNRKREKFSNFNSFYKSFDSIYHLNKQKKAMEDFPMKSF